MSKTRDNITDIGDDYLLKKSKHVTTMISGIVIAAKCLILFIIILIIIIVRRKRKEEEQSAMEEKTESNETLETDSKADDFENPLYANKDTSDPFENLMSEYESSVEFI